MFHRAQFCALALVTGVTACTLDRTGRFGGAADGGDTNTIGNGAGGANSPPGGGGSPSATGGAQGDGGAGASTNPGGGADPGTGGGDPCVDATAPVSLGPPPAANASTASDPIATSTTPGGATVLRKELDGYGNYGQSDSAADILYRDETAVWTFTLPGSITTINEATLRIAVVADDHDSVALDTYRMRIWSNDAGLYGGLANVEHGAPFGQPFANWRVVSYSAAVCPGQNTVTVSNVSTAATDDWLAVDWIELELR